MQQSKIMKHYSSFTISVQMIITQDLSYFFSFAELYFTFSKSFTLIMPSVWVYNAFSVKSILICLITLIYCVSNKSKVTCAKKFSHIFFRSPEAKGFLTGGHLSKTYEGLFFFLHWCSLNFLALWPKGQKNVIPIFLWEFSHKIILIGNRNMPWHLQSHCNFF